MVTIHSITPVAGSSSISRETGNRSNSEEAAQTVSHSSTTGTDFIRSQAGQVRVQTTSENTTSKNMEVVLQDKGTKFEDIKCDVLIVSLFEEAKLAGEAKSADKALNGLIKKAIEDDNFKGKLGSTLILRTNGLIPAKKVIVVGLGKEEKFDLASLRKASAAAIRAAKRENANVVGTAIHGNRLVEPHTAVQTITEVSQLAIYGFDKYKSHTSDQSYGIQKLIFGTTDEDMSPFINKGNLVAKAQKLSRDLSSEPAMTGTPTYLSQVASKVAGENGLDIKVLDRDQCRALGMNAFLAVAQGSDEPPKFIVMRYVPSNVKPKKHVAIIGKGVTFDAGGLSIKTASGMETMKTDKSGAAAVIATMSVIRELNPNVAVTAIVAATENMLGGSAYKPGDVVTAMNGKTIEVLNTDAEGRVTLADAASYAVMKLEPKPDEIIDLATLTGACVVALGDTAGVMTNNQKLADKVLKAGNEAGERMWQLPLYDSDRDHIRSDVADIKNTGAPGKAGAQSGATFIEHFVGDTPWVHIDIAGPSRLDKEDEYSPRGPSGFGVKTLINYLANYA